MRRLYLTAEILLSPLILLTMAVVAVVDRFSR